MKFGQVRDIPREIFFFKNHVEKDAGKLIPDLFVLKSFIRNKSNWSTA